MHPETLRQIGQREGFSEIIHQPDNKMMSFIKGKKKDGDWLRINVYYTTMTVGSCLNHPKKGPTQLFRRNVTQEELIKIFRTPRVHTQKGYYERIKSWFR